MSASLLRTAPGAPWLAGVVPALVTPFDDRGRLDRAALDRLLDRVLAHPVSALSPVGSTGEGPLCSRRMRVEVVRAIAERVGAGVPIVPGAVSTSLEDVAADLDAYAEAGAAAALVPPPFYYRHGSGDAERFVEALLGASPLPLVLYNIPQFTKVPFPPDVVGRLAEHPRVIGLKDSSGDLEGFSAILAALRDGVAFSALTGTDTLLLASLALGAAGTIAASANLVPGLGLEVLSAATSGDLIGAAAAQRRLLAVVTAVRRAGAPWAWKAALHLAGVCGPAVAPPAAPLDKAALERLHADLVALGVLDGGSAVR